MSNLRESDLIFLHEHPQTVTLAYGTRSNLLNLKNRGLSWNCLFGLGVPELVVIAGVAALVFGPKNLPEVGRSIGKTVKSFKQSLPTESSEQRLCRRNLQGSAHRSAHRSAL